MRRWLVLCLLFCVLPLPRAGAQQPLCELPSGFLEGLQSDFETYSGLIETLDVEDPAALMEVYLDLSELRQRYEDSSDDLPDCALRIHSLLMSMFSTMQDSITLAIAIHADPDATTSYIDAINTRNTRLANLNTALQEEIKRLERPVLQVRYVTAEMVNVRSGPGADFAALGRLRQGARLDVISSDLDEDFNTWHEFYYEDGTGWILGELSSLTPP